MNYSLLNPSKFIEGKIFNYTHFAVSGLDVYDVIQCDIGRKQENQQKRDHIQVAQLVHVGVG